MPINTSKIIRSNIIRNLSLLYSMDKKKETTENKQGKNPRNDENITPTLPVTEVKTLIDTFSEHGRQYYDSLQEMDQIGVCVSLKTIPHVYCIERSYGFQKWWEKRSKQM